MTPLYQPPDNCPNGEVCLDDVNLRRRSEDRGEWIRWSVGIVLVILTSLVAWAFGRLGNHETMLGVQGAEINTLKASDMQIHSDLRESKEDYRARLTRIENKQDEILVMLSRRR